MKQNRGKEILSIFLFLILGIVLLSPSISIVDLISNANSEDQVTGAATLDTSKASLGSLATTLPPSYIILTFLTIGLIIGVAEIQTINKKKRK